MGLETAAHTDIPLGFVRIQAAFNIEVRGNDRGHVGNGRTVDVERAHFAAALYQGRDHPPTLKPDAQGVTPSLLPIKVSSASTCFPLPPRGAAIPPRFMASRMRWHMNH